VCDILKSKVEAYPYPKPVKAVTALSSEIVCVACRDDMLRVYKVHERQLRLLATLPHQGGCSLANCVYRCRDAGYVLASADWSSNDLRISVTSRFNRYWLQEMTKIMFTSKILPFCRDVHKIIFKYL